MSDEINRVRDPRTALVQEKYFTVRPKPLERWIWQQGLPQAAERVFWVHWEEGMRGGDWCSQLSLKRVASLCCVDPSTVTRAYQVLKQHGLIRREDPGRDPSNPFQQATAVTEVRLPRELLVELSRMPNRPQRAPCGQGADAQHAARPTEQATSAAQAAVASTVAAPPAPAVRHLSYRDQQRIRAKFSEAERTAYDRAWAEKSATLSFDAATELTAEEQQYVRWQLHLIAHPSAGDAEAVRPSALEHAATPAYAGPRRLAPLETARLRKRMLEAVPAHEVAETFRQVLWAVEEGALRRFEAAKAVNIALKKIREGAWTRPNRMPPQWREIASLGTPAAITPSPSSTGARTETCSAA